MPQDIGLWIKPIVYMLVVLALGLRAQYATRAYGALLPSEERRGAWGYDPEVDSQLRHDPLSFFTGNFLTRSSQVARKRQDDPTIERKRQEATRWVCATILVAILGLPLL